MCQKASKQDYCTVELNNNVLLCTFFCTDILDSCGPSTALGRIVRNDLWDYDVVHVCNLGKFVA